ncbi:hypothetical protein OS493_035684 [Desmophyllum pertusum]|uniref:Uncharacterized protein n=1 Tax=Desmophyllum pertusum TaxID=174260 RepID=A0A9W9YUU0_9CNID|nr:hypothetical protein OS493_035684 [Desmophyllum pertusum]
MSLGILKNHQLIFSALLLIIFVLLHSGGKTEARPADVLQPYTSEDNDTVKSLELLKNPEKPDWQESGIQDEKSLIRKLYTSEDDDTIELLLEQLENPNPDLQDSGIQDKKSAVGESDVTVAQSSRNLSNSRHARDASNPCIKRYVYRIIYNYFFIIPVCKQGCKEKLKIVTFSKGQTRAIVDDCY